MLRRSLRLASSCVLASSIAVACSSAGNDPPNERTESTRAAITDACTLQQVGAPCDAGSGECSGVCTLANGSGGVFATCSPTSSLSANDGKVCGKASDQQSDCNKTCVAGVCVSIAASDGTPCKPHDGTFGGTLCDGVCKKAAGGTGSSCIDRSPLCPGDVPNDCKYSFCDALSGACTNIPLPSGSTCTDFNVCTNESCNGSGTCAVTSFAPSTKLCATGLACTTGDHCSGTDGSCVAGPPVVCTPSTSPCFENDCVEPTGCTPTPKTGAPCTPTSKCFTAGSCSTSGACTPTTPLDCNDGDPCTTDGCADATGCTHATKCTADACHVAACDPTTGACSVTEKDCNDGDPCTTDGCSISAGGCTHTPISGCGVDSGVPDTGSADTGSADTGTIADSGTIVDSGSSGDTGAAKDSAVSDTGPKKDGGPSGDTGGSLDGSSIDGGDGGVDDTSDVNLSNGCGCRVAGESSGSTRLASIAIAAGAAAILARRRRRA